MVQNLRFGLVDSTENCPLRVLWRSLNGRKSQSPSRSPALSPGLKPKTIERNHLYNGQSFSALDLDF